MILTNCAACAAPLGLTKGKKCGRCSTRYCGPDCQKQHWDGGHKDVCKKIKKSGGAELYHADKKLKEAVAEAVEACADDTKGQTCYICTQALHWKTKEGLVRGCACRGTSGVAHVSCLAEQAKILFAEAEENNLGDKAWTERWARWYKCSLCEQHYHGVVECALSWACWKTYVGRPETDWPRCLAMQQLGNGLGAAGHHEDALSVREAEFAMKRRLGVGEENLLGTQSNLAITYTKLGRSEQALRMKRDVYSVCLKLYGEENGKTLLAANNHINSLIDHKLFKEAKSVLRKTVPVARRFLGDNHEVTLRLRCNYARPLYKDPTATLDDLHEAVTALEEAERIARRVLGGAHPTVDLIETSLHNARVAHRAREEGGVDALREAVEAMTPPGSA